MLDRADLASPGVQVELARLRALSWARGLRAVLAGDAAATLAAARGLRGYGCPARAAFVRLLAASAWGPPVARLVGPRILRSGQGLRCLRALLPEAAAPTLEEALDALRGAARSTRRVGLAASAPLDTALMTLAGVPRAAFAPASALRRGDPLLVALETDPGDGGPLDDAVRAAAGRGAQVVRLTPRQPRSRGPRPSECRRCPPAGASSPRPSLAYPDRLLVVYLAWGGAGDRPWRRFLRAYGAFESGAPHDLLVLRRGFADPHAALRLARAAEAAGASLEDDPHAGGPDIAAYLGACARHERGELLFLGTFARPLAPGWLGALRCALEHAPRAGLVGASGSWEGGIRRNVFPNPHIRTTCFLARRAVLEAIHVPRMGGKYDAWAFEHGPRSLTAQVRAAGLEAYVAGRDGRAYPPEAWPASATYVTGGQRNLLVADQRTALAASLAPEDHAELERRVWGPPPLPGRVTLPGAPCRRPHRST